MDSNEWPIHDADSALEVTLRVLPRAHRNEFVGLFGGALKVRVTSPPVEGAANRAVIDLFASALDIPRSRLKIVAGSKSKYKILRIASMSRGEFLERLAGVVQDGPGAKP